MAPAMSPAAQSGPQAAGVGGESAWQGTPAPVAEGAHPTARAAPPSGAQRAEAAAPRLTAE